MKLIAHRGWSIGSIENTIEAFRKSVKDTRVSGVEFDIRRSSVGGKLVLSHDPSDDPRALTLIEALDFLSGTTLDLYVEIKVHDSEMYEEIVRELSTRGLGKRALVFGFEAVACKFDWGDERVRLGIIVKYPWELSKYINKYNPSIIFIGFDRRWWTRPVFYLWWSIFSLKKVRYKHGVEIVAGIARSGRDIGRIKNMGVDAVVADLL